MRVGRAMLPALALLAIAACGHRAGPEPSIDDAWVRLPAVPGRPAAAYFTLHGGTEPARLVAVASPDASDVELHESMTTGSGMESMAGMARLDGVDLAPGASVAFAPGGRHAMLFGLAAKIAPGGRIKLSFRFAKGQPLTLDAKAIAAGDPAPY